MVSVSQALVCGALAAVVVSAQEPSIQQVLAVSPQGNASIQAAVPFQKCGSFASFNWDDAKYVCEWMHYTRTEIYYNVFIKTFSGQRQKECTCRAGVRQYDPWGSRWSQWHLDNIKCYLRRTDPVASIRDITAQFDGFDCPDYEDH